MSFVSPTVLETTQFGQASLRKIKLTADLLKNRNIIILGSTGQGKSVAAYQCIDTLDQEKTVPIWYVFHEHH